jgi:putative DNA primase/helicase
MTTTKKRGDVHVIDNRQCSSFLSEFQQGRPAPSEQNSAVAPIDKVKEAVASLFQGIPPGASPGETAALLAARGLKVFPCEPDDKKPATPHGFKDASTNVRLSGSGARQWATFKSAPGTAVSCPASDCNLAFEPGSSGLLVVDIDPKNGGNETWAELEAKYGRAPPTLEVLTPSGGRHLYFLGTVTAINKQLGRGIDTRCSGGYVLLPPSVVRRKPYRWIDDTVPIAPLPEWVAEILNAQGAN